MVIDSQNTIIFVEVDEHAHRGDYTSLCEELKVIAHLQSRIASGFQQAHIIRFNPDICADHSQRLEQRLETLASFVKSLLMNPGEGTIGLLYVYYPGKEVVATASKTC